MTKRATASLLTISRFKMYCAVELTTFSRTMRTAIHIK